MLHPGVGSVAHRAGRCSRVESPLLTEGQCHRRAHAVYHQPVGRSGSSASGCTELQAKLDRAATLQREHYQVRRLGAKSRKQVYPQLWNNSRVYKPKEAFDISRVCTYLSQVRFTRKTNKLGAFTFYAQRVYAGSSHIHQTLCLQYDIDRNCFRLTDQAGIIIGYVQADNFNAENVLSLNVCQNRYLIAQT